LLTHGTSVARNLDINRPKMAIKATAALMSPNHVSTLLSITKHYFVVSNLRLHFDSCSCAFLFIKICTLTKLPVRDLKSRAFFDYVFDNRLFDTGGALTKTFF